MIVASERFKQAMKTLDWIDSNMSEMRTLIAEAHDKLDDLNARFGEKGDLCLCCHAQRHHSDVGILHRNHCLIVRLRRFA